MDKLQISQIIKELISQGYPEPIIGGTCSLFLQGFDLEPQDIDLYYPISKEEFLDQVHYRRCPKFSISIDWNFYPNLDLRFQEIEIDGVKLRVQKIEDVLDYKLEGLEEDYFPESKRDKHLKFFKNLISDPRVSSDLKSRINQILNIMHGNKEIFENLRLIKDQLFDAPIEVKESFNNMVQYFTPISRGIDDYILWRSISIKDKETGVSITIYGDDGAMILKSDPNDDQKKLLKSLGMNVHKEKIQIGPSEYMDYILVDMQIPKWGSQLQSTARSLSNKYEIHGVPDEQSLKYIREKVHLSTERIKYFDKLVISEETLQKIINEFQNKHKNEYILVRNPRSKIVPIKVSSLIKALNSGYTIATTETFKSSKEATDYINLFDSDDLISRKKSLELEIKQYKEWQNFYHQYTGPDKYKQFGYYAQKLAACRNELDEINEKLNSK